MLAFSTAIQNARFRGDLIVQPRMGFGTVEAMAFGLQSVKTALAPTIGTITLDSYTRVNQYEKASKALQNGETLNGYPIVSHGAATTKAMLQNVATEDFTVQVRHGTALALEVFQTIIASGIDATEGGPISYCLPYSRVSLENAIQNWTASCQLFANASTPKKMNHIESFAGCMLGQLCPPSLLIALDILEGLFFKENGIVSLSLSYAQGTHINQDIAALKVLRELANEYLKNTDWHVVMYTYMGLFPTTVLGAYQLISDSAKVAALSQCERLIVKTPAEAYRIPTIKENIGSLEMAYSASKDLENFPVTFDRDEYQKIYQEAKLLIEATLTLDKNLGKAFVIAFERGFLDIPYCLHHQNAKLSRSYIDSQGYLRWAHTGNLPFENKTESNISVSSQMLLNMLSHVRNKYDHFFEEKAC